VTPPVRGVVKDGADAASDIMYTSETATVASTWSGFSDPESGIDRYHVDIFRKPKGQTLLLSDMQDCE